MQVSNFNRSVYQKTKLIPKGKISTYAEIARSLNTKAYQAIGRALSTNPFSPNIPCHRVIRSNGQIGGFKGQKAGKLPEEKIKILLHEGVEIKNGKIVNFQKYFFQLGID